jgi:hypothetical protein
MGAQVSVAEDQRPLGQSSSIVATRDEEGRELLERVPTDPGVVLKVIHFVDLDDCRRITTKASGEISLQLPRTSTPDEVRKEIRECIFEDEMREAAAEEIADEPRWPDMLEILLGEGVATDEAALASLPFVIELDDAVTDQFGG